MRKNNMLMLCLRADDMTVICSMTHLLTSNLKEDEDNS